LERFGLSAFAAMLKSGMLEVNQAALRALA
jgi:hypothetical protein